MCPLQPLIVCSVSLSLRAQPIFRILDKGSFRYVSRISHVSSRRADAHCKSDSCRTSTKFPVQRCSYCIFMFHFIYICTLLQCAVPFIRLAASKERLQYVRRTYVCVWCRKIIAFFFSFGFISRGAKKNRRSTENYMVCSAAENT